MADRLKSVRRVLAVQTQLHKLAQWKLADLASKDDDLRQKQESLVRFTDEDGSYGAIFSNALMRRLRMIGEERARCQNQHKLQEEKTAEERQKLGRMQSRAEELEDLQKVEAERKELAESLERLVARPGASSRKA
jgi:hypothetical protein